MTTGRNVEELLRLVAALQTTDTHDISTPEGWQPGQDVILAPPLTAEEAYQRHEAGTDWYYRTGPLPDAAKRPRRRSG
jgi:peroxiredoxin (alkyl hydroperoxide reductase subunit C)